MRLDVIYSTGLIGILLLALYLKRRFASTFSATSHKNAATAYEIPHVIKQLQQSARDGNFVVFLFVPPDSTDGEAVNLQYSIEDGIIGLDWVLIGPRNIADRTKISEFAATLGYRFKECEMNDTRYLRVTGSGISDLGKSIIKDFYKLNLNTKLDLVTEGFEWQPQAFV
jgi:hypothetical protein